MATLQNGGNISLVWTTPPSVMGERVGEYENELPDDVFNFLTDMASAIESYARASAPWNDVTGAARAGLTADVFRVGDQLVLALWHTVPYGIWLEVRWGGALAVIMPTMESYYGRIMDGLRALSL